MARGPWQFARLAAIALVAVGCYQVLHPFIPAILFAVVVCLSTWPLYRRLRLAFRGRSSLAALAMVALLLGLVIGPTALLAYSLTDNLAGLIESARGLLDNGPIQAPAWLKAIPLVGVTIDAYWQDLAAGRTETLGLFEGLLAPARDVLFIAGKAIAESLIQMTFAIFIGFFLFRDGDALVRTLRTALDKLAGPVGTDLLATLHGTVASVVNGLFGTALAQALVAWIGYRIAGVPGAFLLGIATFFFSIVPIGPPLLWGGATVWLIGQGAIGWAIFMALWGLFAISGIDNLVKPYLISQGSGLPMLPIVLGVFGGVVAFGFIGLFIGPPLLAVGLALVRLWTAAPTRDESDTESRSGGVD
ncbi:MAG: AI-2E family transporter [Thiobacillus sp.]|nr:AI-2E family transporter [Thiobacillus sp.]